MAAPDFNLLMALDNLLAEESVAGAARRLGLSASAMSRTLARLRAVTGDPLLVRAGRVMVLTPYAQAIRERTRQAVSEAQAILRPAFSEISLPTLERTFTLRTNDGFVEAFGAQLIAAAADVAPQVRLCFTPKPEKSAKPLRDGTVDLEIGVLGETGPEIRLQGLFRDRFIGVVRKGHPLIKNVTPEGFAAAAHVVASRRGIASGPVDEALAKRGLERKVSAVVASFQAALAVAISSDLVAQVPASFIMHQPDRHAALEAFELPVSVGGFTVSQMWHPRSESDAAHRWLRQLINEVCRQ
ncbi:LysR family transcriptional regulator [Erwinia sp. 9145]|uniref:LysR family transcriptional regulator n=1 Tax=Erwinia sp. 9145 TaxID=1500895 RepID=UPI000557C98F|nr:LysR family transcriptional regulator [Erwinia sp. 9145]